MRNGWSYRLNFDVEVKVKKIGILVEINEILLKSSTRFRRTSRFSVVSTSEWHNTF